MSMNDLPFLTFAAVDRGNAQRHRHNLIASFEPHLAALDVHRICQVRTRDCRCDRNYFSVSPKDVRYTLYRGVRGRRSHVC